ncbi:MAG: hypothetical protein LBF39_02150 [Prevotellaceae bacterium]|jgi:hypothetical protein|nr:hypothetical protein [Prevotellaceae bacterium]
MSNRNFLPNNDQALLSWVVNFLGYLASILPRIGFPESVYTELVALRDRYAQKLSIADSPVTRTKASVQEKNEAKKSLVSRLRQTIGEYLTRNHMVTDADRDNLGLPVHKTTRTPAPVATTHPSVEINTSELRRVGIHFFDGSSGQSDAKPFGQHGAETAWALFEHPQEVHISDLTHSSFDTHTPLKLEFADEDRGKTLYFALRWENTTGEKGPFGPVMSAIVP